MLAQEQPSAADIRQGKRAAAAAVQVALLCEHNGEYGRGTTCSAAPCHVAWNGRRFLGGLRPNFTARHATLLYTRSGKLRNHLELYYHVYEIHY